MYTYQTQTRKHVMSADTVHRTLNYMLTLQQILNDPGELVRDNIYSFTLYF